MGLRGMVTDVAEPRSTKELGRDWLAFTKSLRTVCDTAFSGGSCGTGMGAGMGADYQRGGGVLLLAACLTLLIIGLASPGTAWLHLPA